MSCEFFLECSKFYTDKVFKFKNFILTEYNVKRSSI